MTDHKLLIGIFNKIKAQALFRIKRIRLKLKAFRYTVEHIYDASNPSDDLSRYNISATNEDLRQTKYLEAYVNYIFQSPVNEPAISLDELKDVVNKDRVALKWKKAIGNGTANKNDTKMTELPSGP